MLFTELTPNELSLYGELNENFNADRIHETVEEIRKTIKKVQQTGKFSTLTSDCIEAGISPRNNEDELKEWAESKGISPGLAGPPIDVNELARAVEKIKSKLLQLPETEPGIIVIPTTASSLLWRYDIESVSDFLSDKISSFPKVYCVVLTYKFFSGEVDNSYAAVSPDFAFVNRNIKGVTEQAIMIFNKTYAGQMSQSFAQKLRRAFLYI